MILERIKKHILFTLSVLVTLTSFAQKADPADAEEHFKFHNYIDALIVYKKLIEKDPKNADYPYKAGYSILHTDRDKSEAIKFLETASERKSDPDVDFYLAKAYHYNMKLDEALDAFEKYQKSGVGTKQAEVAREIEMVKNAMLLVKSPIDVSFENAGDKINTEYPDYYPLVTPDESYLFFTSRRKGVMGGAREFDGYYSSDVFYTKVENGEFIPAKGAGAMVNSIYDEQAVGLSYNADKLFVYMDNIKEFGDIYESKMNAGKFKKIEKLGEAINSKGFESAATISADENILFFASRRDDGLGEKDIYMTRKLPTGDWAEPQNLGNTINTPYDEDFPNLFYDGKTLYFSSKGHNSIGGYDYFKSTWDETANTWSKPQNLGYPLNTPEDNLCISFIEDQSHAYISTWMKDSKGEKDIYKVTFNEIDSRQTIIKSKVLAQGSTEAIKNALINVVDVRTQEEVGNYTPNPKSGAFTIILKPGTYKILVDAPGFAPKTENVTILGKSDFIAFTEQEFVVTP